MDALNEEAVKFFNVEEDEENGQGEDEGKRSDEKKRDSSVKKSSWFEPTLSSFKEDNYFISDLRESEKKALQDLKLRIESAVKSNEFFLEGVGANSNHKAAAASNNGAKDEKPTKQNPGQNGSGNEKTDQNVSGKEKPTAEVLQSYNDNVTMWGIPLLHTKGDERTDVILLKFLRARDFRVNDAFIMLQNSVAWRKAFGADSILEEELKFDENLDSVAFMHCYDKKGHPVCYNAYGIFRDKELYQKIFGDDEKLKKFLRWRVQILEKGIKLLNFKPGGVNAMVQITDLKNMPKRELRAASNHILALFQDNYPEMVARKVFVNVPWYFSALYSMLSPFMTQRTKSKFVIAREGKVTETLYKFISPFKQGSSELALRLWEQMLENGILPDSLVFSSMIYGFCQKGETQKVQHFLNEMLNADLIPSTHLCNTLMDGLCKQGSIAQAFIIRKELAQRGIIDDAKSFTRIITALRKRRRKQG